MNKERKYKNDPKTGKKISYVLFVLRIILILVCIWGLYLLFSR
jgi:hypothetical protein